jgi:predicted nucleotidyltransferase
MAYIHRMSAMAEPEIKSRIADPIVLSALRELDRSLHERFEGRYLKLLLFGSRARGDNLPESDADVAVIFRGRITDRWSLKRLIIEETYPILVETGLYIQPWPLEEDELSNPDKSSNPALLRNVVREGISL